jgi:hypothetical protein
LPAAAVLPGRSDCAADSGSVYRAGVQQHEVVLVDDLRVGSWSAVGDGAARLHQHEAAIVGHHSAALRLDDLDQLPIADRHLVPLSGAAIAGA